MVTKGIVGIAMFGLAAVAAPAVSAQETPKSGHIIFDAYVTNRIVQSVDIGIGKGVITESDDFDKLVNGKAPFDLLTFRCVQQDQFAGQKWIDGSGSCMKTDKDGDHIFYIWDKTGWTFVGGTGKFNGITGKGTAKPIYYHDSGARGWELIAHHESDWAIK
jgi:hypothetical protein